jgi:transcriptional regulator with XRE-family HTH domain
MESREMKERDERLRRELGERIVRLREKRGLSRTNLARRLGVGRSRLGKWENGAHTPPLGYLDGLAEVLDVSPAELLTGRVPDPPAALPPQAEETIRGVIRILGALVETAPSDRGVKEVDDSAKLL